MNIDNSFLQSFIGGVQYFRFPTWASGPDWYHLFRWRILNICLDKDSGLWIEQQDLNPNRFETNEWVEHKTQEGIQSFKIRETWSRGVPGTLPRFSILSPTIIFIECDLVAESVLYANEGEQPDSMHVFRDFRPGHEQLAGLGSLT